MKATYLHDCSSYIPRNPSTAFKLLLRGSIKNLSLSRFNSNNATRVTSRTSNDVLLMHETRSCHRRDTIGILAF